MTITEFLEARVSEDEALAALVVQDAEDRNLATWEVDALEVGGSLPGPQMTARFSPARVLAECAAKRAIIMSYRSCIGAEERTDIAKEFGVKLTVSGMVKGLELAIKFLTTTYRDHADYREDWAL